MPDSEFIEAFRAVLEDVQIVPPVDCTVLQRGETDAGMEVAAQAIHDASPRRRHPFKPGDRNEADEPNRFNEVNDVQC